MYDRWFTIALLTAEFGQVWAKLGLRKSRTTLGEIVHCTIVQLQTKDQLTSTIGIWASLGKAGITKIARLHNCAVADITPQLWHDVTPQQRLKCKEMDGGTNVMITYDATKMDGAYSDGIINNTPLFHKIFMNI